MSVSARETAYYVKLQALIQALLEDTVNFEEEALRNVGGKEILSFIDRDPRVAIALNNLYILKLLEYIEKDTWDYTPAELEFLIGYVTNKYPLRAKVEDFMKKIREALRK